MFWCVFTLLVAASKLEKCIFDDFDIEQALELEPTEPIDHALRYFTLKRFRRDEDAATFTLLSSPEDNEYVGMILARSNELGSHVFVSPTSKNTILRQIGERVATQFYTNRYNFRDLVFLERAVPQVEIRDVVKNVWTGDPWIVSKFFFYIETRDIRLEDVVEEVRYLAKKGDKQALCLLGLMHLYGIGVAKDLEKALEYFWSNGVDDMPQSLIGIARVYMDSEFRDDESAIKTLDQALKGAPNAEASYCLYLLLRDKGEHSEANALKSQRSEVDALKSAAYSGYLPAVYHYGVYLSDNGIVESSNTSLSSVVAFHPGIIRLDTLAYNSFLEGNYRKAFLIYLFLCEFRLPSAIKNSIYLIEKYNLFIDQEIVMCDIFRSLAKTEMKYGKQLGDCYFYGNGVKKSLLSAFSSYLSSRKFSEEGAYNAAMMYEYGLGIPQNLYEARRIISKYIYHETSYLVRLYSLIRINAKILVYHHYILSTIFILTGITASVLLFVKGR